MKGNKKKKPAVHIKETDAVHITPLCANHADMWYCERNNIKTKSGCVFCDLHDRIKQLENDNNILTNEKAALARKFYGNE